MPFSLGMTLDTAMKQSKELRERYQSEHQVKELFDMAQKVEGMPRHASTHAAGVVITDRPVMDYVPLSKNDDAVVTQYTMTAIEELGLLKMDFLGLRNLSVIDNAQKMIRQKDPAFSVDTVSQDDPAVFQMLSQGNSEGVFQLESPGMKRLLVQAQPTCMEDIIAIISLYRPGPMQFITQYLESRKDPSSVRYRHELLRPILAPTGGCIIYQEQVMQIFRDLAGYSLGRADIVRRAMAKKSTTCWSGSGRCSFTASSGRTAPGRWRAASTGAWTRPLPRRCSKRLKTLQAMPLTSPTRQGTRWWPTRPPTSSATTPVSIWQRCFPACWARPVRWPSTSRSAAGWGSPCCRPM